MKRTVALILAVLITALTLCSCSADKSKDLEEVYVGVITGAAPHMEIFHSIEARLPEFGYELIYKSYDTAAQANNALANGEIDFTCVTTQKEYELSKMSVSGKFVNLGAAYYYPYVMILISYDTKDEIENGATVAIPSDTDGMTRALTLLEYYGFIKLKTAAQTTLTLDDIEKNDREFNFVPVGPDKVTGYDADIIITDSVRAIAAGYEMLYDTIYVEQKDALATQRSSTVILSTPEKMSGDKMKVVKEYLFTRRMFNAIDGCTDHIVMPAFEDGK